MSEPQADRLIREIRNLKGVCFLAAAVAAVFVGFWIMSEVSQRNPTAILDRELTLMRKELQMLRDELSQPGTKGGRPTGGKKGAAAI